MAAGSELREAAAAFRPEGRTCPIEVLGAGNINETYLVRSAQGPLVLQKINDRVFAEPRRVADNFARVTAHLRQKQRDQGLVFLTAEPVRTLAGDLCYLDKLGGLWRGQTYLAGVLPAAPCLAGVSQVERAGRTLARFHCLTADLDVSQLAEPLPGFHHLPGYMAELERVLAGEPPKLGDAGRFCLETIDRIRPGASLLEDARKAGVLTVQPIHGDPKIDNFIFTETGVDGMLDFDTVGGGLIHYDLGDCLRSCCNRSGEKGSDPSTVAFDLDYCRLLLEGYFSAGPLLAERQYSLIYEAASLISFELGVRFFTDHLRGNTYFRVASDGENLIRAVRQFRLVEDIAAKEREIRRIIATAARRQPESSLAGRNGPGAMPGR